MARETNPRVLSEAESEAVKLQAAQTSGWKARRAACDAEGAKLSELQRHIEAAEACLAQELDEKRRLEAARAEKLVRLGECSYGVRIGTVTKTQETKLIGEISALTEDLERIERALPGFERRVRECESARNAQAGRSARLDDEFVVFDRELRERLARQALGW